MTRNSDDDFNLKEWVVKRAANQIGEGVSVPAGQNDHAPEQLEASSSRILGSRAGKDISKDISKDIHLGEKPLERLQTLDRLHDKEKPRMTRYTNGVAANGHHSLNGTNGHVTRAASTATAAAPAATADALQSSPSPAQAVQQLQIVRLLQDLGERLRQSEKEREILWREVDGCRKLLSDIEDKTSKTEKAYLSLEHKLQSTPSADQQAELDKLTRALGDKISALETTTGSAILRVEDAISENAKLARRLDQVSQDKARLLRKVETMEETLTQTQDALKAKALVLLTDQALAVRTPLPQAPVWSGNDTLRMAPPQAQPAQTASATPLVDGGSLFRRNKRVNMNTTLLVALVATGVLGGWAISKVQVPEIPVTATVQDSGAAATAVPAGETGASAKTQDELMADIARLASQIEPAGDEDAASLRPDEQLDRQAEKAALAAFNGEAMNGKISDRIEADQSLPKAVKDIENRAFAGEPEAQHDLAAIYTAGHAGVKTNYAQAALWFNEAAHNNVANAQYNLGVLYHQGLGVRQDTRKAIMLYRVAASNGHPEAQYNLGIAHIEGVGADYSPRVATRYFEAAAAGGIVEAAYNLGLIQENSLLGDARPDEAVFWYKIAADRGNVQARQALTQLQKQRNLSDADVGRIHDRIAADRPNAFVPKSAAASAASAAEGTETSAAPEIVPAVAPQTAVQAEAPAGGKAKARYETVIVTQIQEQLSRLGLYNGEADGVANPATEDAVRQYQALNKLKVDGQATEDVLVHMLAHDLQMQEPAAQ